MGFCPSSLISEVNSYWRVDPWKLCCFRTQQESRTISLFQIWRLIQNTVGSTLLVLTFFFTAASNWALKSIKLLGLKKQKPPKKTKIHVHKRHKTSENKNFLDLHISGTLFFHDYFFTIVRGRLEGGGWDPPAAPHFQKFQPPPLPQPPLDPSLAIKPVKLCERFQHIFIMLISERCYIM